MSFHDNVLKEGSDILDPNKILSSFWDSIPSQLNNQINLIVKLGRILLIFSIAYIFILILIKMIGFLFGSKETRILKRINGQLDEVISLMKKGKLEKKIKK